MFFYLSKALWFLATPSNCLCGLVCLGAVASFRPRWSRPGRGLALVAICGLILAGLGPVGTWLLLPLEDRFPIWHDDGRPVAGIVVLGGAVYPRLSFARGQLQVNEAAERMIAMADLARRYPGARVVFSGGSGSPLFNAIAEADAVARFGGELGLDPSRVTYENQSRTTYENAADVRALVQPKPGERWLLVTSAWHMPRAIGSFRQAGFPITAYPVDYLTRGPQHAFDVRPSIADGLERVDLAAKEWAGLLAYRLSGRTDALLPSP